MSACPCALGIYGFPRVVVDSGRQKGGTDFNPLLFGVRDI